MNWKKKSTLTTTISKLDIRKLVLFLLAAFGAEHVEAQLVLLPIDRVGVSEKESKAAKTQALQARPLPFWDDFSFSNSKFYPNDTLWEYSNSITISDGIGINLPSLKVGSFDGQDSTGRPYSVNDVLAKGLADKLVSRPIRLDLVDPTERNSVFLSFYYQFQGNGEPPDSGDQLILSFKGADGIWNIVQILEDDGSLVPDQFLQVLIGVSDDDYFHNNFQFMFQNFGRLSGPYDNWNVDYVYLNRGRNPTDTSYPDRTISSALTSPFDGFWAMPIDHYFINPTAQAGSPAFEIYNLRAGNNQPLNYFSYAEISQFQNGVENKQAYLLDSAQDVGGSLPGLQRRIVALTTLPDPNVFDPSSDSIKVNVKIGLSTKDNVPPSGQGDYDPSIFNPIDFRSNDTIRASYKLADYYAYDDGEAEYGAALNQAGSRVAYLFEMRTSDPDTLVAADLYFPRFGDDTSQSIELQILRDLNDEPGSILHRQTQIVQRAGFNKFHRVQLTQPVGVQDKFYIGWKQLSFAVIAIGYDKNSNSGSKIYFNTGNSWKQDASLIGSLMLRPVFGDGMKIINEASEQTDIKIYPNPSKGIFFVSKHADQLAIFDSTGKSISFSVQLDEDKRVIQLESATPGIYLIRYLRFNEIKTSRVLVIQ